MMGALLPFTNAEEPEINSYVVKKGAKILLNKEDLILKQQEVKKFIFIIDKKILDAKTKVYISLKARGDRQKYASTVSVIAIRVNKELLDYTTLVNHPVWEPVKNGMVRFTHNKSWLPGQTKPVKKGSFRFNAGPGFDTSKLPLVSLPVDEKIDPWKNIVDITEFIKDGRNEIELINSTTPKLLNILNVPEYRMVIKEANLICGYIEPYKSPALGTSEVKKYISPRKKWDENFDIKAEQGGAVTILFKNGDEYTIESRLSHPGGFYNKLTVVEDNKRFQPVIITNKNSILVNADSEAYSLRRKVVKYHNRIDITDTIINKSDQDLGIKFSNYVSKAKNITSLNLCGAQLPLMNIKKCCPENPTMLLMRKSNGLGMVAIDDGYRLYSSCYFKEISNEAGIECRPGIGIPKGKSYSIKWSVYPLSSTSNYYSFINSIRRDWEVDKINFNGVWLPVSINRIKGIDNESGKQLIYNFFSQKTTPSKRKNRIERIKKAYGNNHPGYVNIGGFKKWFFDAKNINIKNKDAVFGTYWSLVYVPLARSYIKALVEDLRIAFPKAKILIYNQTCIESIDNALVKYKDSIHRYNNGKPYKYFTYYPMFDPTTKNSFGKTLLEYCVRTDLDELGTDMFYWDVFYSYPPEISEVRPWDNLSVILDKNFNIKAKRNHYAKNSENFKIELIKQIKKRKKSFLCNDAPITTTIMKHMRDIGAIGFLEANTDLSKCYKTHLYTPMVLQPRTSVCDDKGTYNQIRTLLEYGTIIGLYRPSAWFTFSDNPLRDIFPITPQELNCGYIIDGKNSKIVTVRSGYYGFNDNSKLTVKHYGEDGHYTGKKFKTIEKYGKSYIDLNLADRELAVITKDKSQ
jgi:hypothetical protein